MTWQPRSPASGEKVFLRKAGRWSALYLAGVETPRTIFAARIDQVFAAPTATNKPYDMITEVAYDTVTTGAYTDILPGMTMWIGSAAGLRDVGEVRIRKAATSSKVYFGMVSDVAWANNLYLTVIDEMGIWAKHSKTTAGVTSMDVDVAYSDQHSDFDPITVAGSDIVLDVAAYPAATAEGDLDSSDSSVFGSSISSHAWTASAGVLTDANTSTPILTVSSYPTGGKIRLKCTTTAANGKSSSHYIWVHVYDATHRPHEVFQLTADPQGSFEDGGWSFEVTMLADATLTNVRDRAHVILFSEDHYGVLDTDEVSIGQQQGRENIIVEGWIEGASIEWNADFSAVQFAVSGANYWMDKMDSGASTIKFSAGAPAAWNAIPALTVDRALWHYLHWRSTVTAVMDVRLTGDTRLAPEFEVSSDSLWQQITAIAEDAIFAHPCCDRFNRLFVQVDSQMVPEASRSTIPVIMEIEKQDRLDRIEIPNVVVDEAAKIFLSSMKVSAAGNGTPLYSLANGHMPKRYGDVETEDHHILAATQAQSNQLAGLLAGKNNNPYPEIEIPLAQNNRMIDICPRQYLEIVIEAGDTVRGIEYDGNIIPRVVTLAYNAETGAFSTVVNCEAETFEQIAIKGDPPPDDPPLPPTPPTPPIPPVPPPPPPPGPVGSPTDVLLAGHNSLASDVPAGLYFTENFDADNPDIEYNEMNDGLEEAEYTNVCRIKKCPSGLILIAIQSGAYIKSIYYAAGLGDVWTLLIDDAMVDQGSYGSPAICAFGVNPNKNEEIIVVGGGYDGLADGHKMAYIGDRYGLVEVAGDLDITNQPGDISYALNKWLLTTSRADALSRGSWTTFDASGTIIVNDLYPTGMAYQAYAFHQRRAGKIFMPTSALGDYMRVIADNDGQCSPEVVLALPIGYGLSASALAVSPSGLKMICGELNTASYKSDDAGANWTALAGIGSYNRAWENCDTEDGFIGVAGQNIQYTDDFGVTWYAKSGNLPTINNLYVVDHIKYING